MHVDASFELGPKGNQLEVPGEHSGKGFEELEVV